MTVAPIRHTSDVESFREVMAALAAGVAVVTTVDADGKPRGMTTTAVTSVSLEPPLLLVCAAHESRTLAAIRHSGRFAVNLIEAAACHVAVHFASKAPQKFGDSGWRTGRHGSPVLHEHVLAWAECRVEREIEAGDHVVLIGRVEHAAAVDDERAPLTYFRRRFGTWAQAEHTEQGDAR
jgi:flavin reductase (DIM6/NTAB) family NADH-FMN oxidoreductase RutF